MAYNEAYNAFLQGVNDISNVPNARNYVDDWYRYLFMRQIASKFYADREEENGFSGSTTALGQTVVTLYPDFMNLGPMENPLTDMFGEREAKYRVSERTEPPRMHDRGKNEKY